MRPPRAEDETARRHRLLGAAAPVGAFEFAELSLALAFAGVGAIVGQGFAAYRHGRNPRANTAQIVFSWTMFGFVVGWLVVLLDVLR